MEIREVIEVSRPPEVVFPYLAEFEHLAEWDPATVSVSSRSAGPLAIGTSYEVVSAFRGREVELKLVGHGQDVAEDVGHFVGHLGELFRLLGEQAGLFFGEPLKMLHELGGLDRHRHGQVLGGVEPMPIAAVDEVVDHCAELGYGHFGVLHGTHSSCGGLSKPGRVRWSGGWTRSWAQTR